MHAEVALRVKMAIGKNSGLTPVMQRVTLLVMEKSHNALFVEDVSFPADKWGLHLIDLLLEELFVFTGQ